MTSTAATRFVTSTDGTRIAFDQQGDGSRLILGSGLLCTRRTLADLAGHLARQFTVINYDRRGRGESGDTRPYAVERELEDVAALITAAGGAAAVYGHSSGPGVALRAAASGLPVTRPGLVDEPRLVIHPLVLGGGKAMFKDVSRRHSLCLTESAAIDGGLVRMRYAVAQ